MFIRKSKKNEVIIKNEYYPDGLRENDIYEYFLRNKESICIGTGNNNVALLIATDQNKFVIKRNIGNSVIKINPENYEKIIFPRVVSIFVEIPSLTNIICLDIDSGGHVSENRMKVAVADVIDVIDELYEEGYTVYNRSCYRIISTSTGYQVFVYMNKKRSIEKNFELSLELFKPLKDKYVYNSRKYSSTDIIIDFSPMKRRGLHMCPWSVCKNGLVSVDVTYTLEKFNRRKDAIIYNFIR